MSNGVLPTITIDLILDRLTTKDVLRGILHAILFHRLFGKVTPQTFEILDVTMPGIADPEIEQLVHEKVETFWRGIEGGRNKKGQILITFSERRQKRNWFTTAEEDVPWEQWIINAELRHIGNDTDRQSFNANLAATLTKAIYTMITYTSSERGRAVVPLITDAAGISPFPFKIIVVVGSDQIG